MKLPTSTERWMQATAQLDILLSPEESSRIYSESVGMVAMEILAAHSIDDEEFQSALALRLESELAKRK